MNAFASLFLGISSIALLLLPRGWAPLPLMAATCFMTVGQAVNLGPFTFSFVRLVILVGLIRVMMRREWKGTKLVGLDKLMMAWGAWFAFASLFHERPFDTLVFHSGLIYNTCGSYFLLRCFCRNVDDLTNLVKALALILVPVALAMLYEQATRYNVFSVFGGVPENPLVRDGRTRSQGPFRHAILAGTVGAVCLPLMVGVWRKDRLMALVGGGACLVMIAASASSGPILSALVAVGAIAFWRWRQFVRHARIAALLGYVLLELAMSRPAYYIITYMDVTGSSAAYFRARLIQSAFQHLDEWWFAGTDHTRHWMPTGVSANPDHTDITNHYLGQGVKGGLPLMLLFVLVIWAGFQNIGRSLRRGVVAQANDRFLMWCFGAALFAHAATCISVAYFDQSVVFLYLNLAVSASLLGNSTRRFGRSSGIGKHSNQASPSREAGAFGSSSGVLQGRGLMIGSRIAWKASV